MIAVLAASSFVNIRIFNMTTVQHYVLGTNTYSSVSRLS